MPPPGTRRDGQGDGSAGAGPAYDSFVVKVWHDRDADVWRRAEVHHVQTELTDTARDVEPGWVWRTLLAILASPQAAPPSSGPADTPRSRTSWT